MNVIFHHAKRINNGLVSYEQPPYLFPQEELLANAVVDASTNPSYPDLTATEMYALFYPTWQPYFVWDSYLEGYTIL